jgi:hypothetical protein
MVSSCGIPWLLLHLILLESTCWRNSLFCGVNGFQSGIVGKMKIGSPFAGYSGGIHPTRHIITQLNMVLLKEKKSSSGVKDQKESLSSTSLPKNGIEQPVINPDVSSVRVPLHHDRGTATTITTSSIGDSNNADHTISAYTTTDFLLGSLSNLTLSITKEFENSVAARAKETELSSDEFSKAIQSALHLIQQDIPKAIEQRIAEAVEEIAFNDTPLLGGTQEETPTAAVATTPTKITTARDPKLEARSLRTRELMRYWRAAPLYYTIALMYRFLNKLPGPKAVLLALTRTLSLPLKSTKLFFPLSTTSPPPSSVVLSGIEMQQGWKKTGEMAAKGSFRRNTQVLLRSIEIWGYFVNFYVREKRYSSKFTSGKWTQEQFSAARSQLGKEITQNILKLGPCFIKVRMLFHCTLPLCLCAFLISLYYAYVSFHPMVYSLDRFL